MNRVRWPFSNTSVTGPCNSLRRRWSSLGFVCAGHLVLSKERASMLRCFQLWKDQFDGVQIFKTSRDLALRIMRLSWKVVNTSLNFAVFESLKPANLGTVVVLWLREKCHTNSSLLDTFSEAEKLRPDWCFRVIYARIWRNGLHPLGSSLRHSGQHWSSGGEVSTATQSLEVIVSVLNFATTSHCYSTPGFLQLLPYSHLSVAFFLMPLMPFWFCRWRLCGGAALWSRVARPTRCFRLGVSAWEGLTPEVLVAWTCKVLLGDTEAVRTVIVACFGCALCVAWLQLMCFLQWFVCDFTESRVSANFSCLLNPSSALMESLEGRTNLQGFQGCLCNILQYLASEVCWKSSRSVVVLATSTCCYPIHQVWPLILLAVVQLHV